MRTILALTDPFYFMLPSTERVTTAIMIRKL